MFKLKALEIENFRSFKNNTRVDIDNLTTIIGRNDAGKSTILEALEIFFNNDIVKIDKSDVNVFSKSDKVRISCIFEESTQPIILDEKAVTTIREEYLLNNEGDFEIIKEYDGKLKTIKPKIYIKAAYPSILEESIINLTNTQLKSLLQELKIDDPTVIKSSNVSIRQGIYNHLRKKENFKLEERKILLTKQDGKKLWDTLQSQLPMFALFKADRPSNDEDDEVQNPMKVAVKQALKEVEGSLNEIKEKVRKEAMETANNTLEKLHEMDKDLAEELLPNFAAEPKWDKLFKLSLDSEHGISINKRGSGVRRLILLNFFRSEVERQRTKEGRGVIYAIEEPETAQHPENQKMLIDALRELAVDNCQVLLTTHVPGVAELLPTESIRFVTDETKFIGEITSADEKQLSIIAEELGVIPSGKVKLVVCVEGKNDVIFLKHLSRILHSAGQTSINLFTDSRIVVIPTGGVNSLKDFINRKYLQGFDLPEIYIVDRDESNEKKIKGAIVTKRREMENYIHPDVIKSYLTDRYPSLKGIESNINFEDIDSEIPKEITAFLKENKSKLNNDDPPSERAVKNWLNGKVAARMTYKDLQEIGVEGELKSWFKEMEKMLEQDSLSLAGK